MVYRYISSCYVWLFLFYNYSLALYKSHQGNKLVSMAWQCIMCLLLSFELVLHIESAWTQCELDPLYHSLSWKATTLQRFLTRDRKNLGFLSQQLCHDQYSYLLNEQQSECIWTIQQIFLECSDTFHVRDSLFRNLQTIQDCHWLYLTVFWKNMISTIRYKILLFYILYMNIGHLVIYIYTF